MVKSHSKLARFLLNNLQEITSPEQVFQINKVLRLKENDRFIGINEGKEFLLEIKQITKKHINFKVIEELPLDNERELPFGLKIYLPFLKGEKLDWVLQKCTELGANQFQFVEFEHSVKQISNFEHKLERWNKIITEAVEQSERLKTPEILSPISISEITLAEGEVGYAFIERIQGIETKLLNSQSKNISLIFGPEGGFSELEKEIILKKNFQAISLGKRILRSETAIIAGTALFSICL